MSCPKCGSINKSDSNFCNSCGTRLEKDSENASIYPDKFRTLRIISKVVWKLMKIILIMLWWLLTRLWRLMKAYLFPALTKVYYRIPRRRTVVAVLIGVLVICISTPIIISQIQTRSTLGKSYVMKKPNQAAKKILSGTWKEQQAATREILSHSGFEVVEGDKYPRGGFSFMLPPEITLLTDDASRKANGGRITLVQFTNVLKELGFPFAEGKDPILLMQSGLRNWVIAAIQDPSAEGAQIPLFLQTMALNQLPAIDLTHEDWDPDLYRLTYLEMEVFLGAFIHAAVPKDMAKTGFMDRMLGTKTAHAADTLASCSYAKQWFGQLGDKHGVSELTTFNIELISMLAAELTGKAIDSAGEVVSKAVTSISASMKLMKLGMLYWSIEVNVVPSTEQIHKPAPNEGDKDVTFTAKVGVNEEKYKEYLEGWSATPLAKEIKDCLSFAGLPMPTDIGEIAADVENWSVEWDIVKGGGEHALIGLDKNKFDFKGQFQMKVNRVNKISGEAKLVTDITKEKVNQHKGYDHTSYVVARALVETSKPPGLGTLISSGKTGAGAADSGLLDILALSDTLLDVLAGWYQEIAEPEASGYYQVAYHTQQYPKYTYQGSISVTHYYNKETSRTSDKNHRNEYTTSYSHQLLTARGNWNVRLILGYESELQGVFSMRAEKNKGSLNLSENYTSKTKLVNYCINGNAPTITDSKSTRNGSGTVESEWVGGLERARKPGGGYTFTLSGSESSSDRVMVTLNSTQIQTNSAECTYIVPGTHVSTKAPFEVSIDDGAFPDGFKFTTDSKEEYPKTISGSTVTKGNGGGESMWTFNFQRIDPVPEGK